MADCRTSFDSGTAGSREGGTIRCENSARPPPGAAPEQTNRTTHNARGSPFDKITNGGGLPGRASALPLVVWLM